MEREGLLESIPRVGCRVKQIQWDDVEEICEIRTVNETPAARWAMKRITPKDRQALEESLAVSKREVKGRLHRGRKMHEIKLHGRGGQGVVMASQMLGLAFFRAGMHPQCYSLFGGERRGAPVVSFLRVDQQKVLLKCEIKHPNELLCFDESLLNPDELRTLMRPGARILVSTNKTMEAFQTLSGFNLGLVDATAIAEKLGLGHVINSTVLGAYCRLTGRPSLEDVIEAVEEMVPANKEKNVEAVRHGYANLTLLNHGER